MNDAGDLARRLSLVVITDPDCGPGRELVEVVRAALQGGAPAVQLRAKRESTRALLELARVLREETRRAGALLFVNDRVDVALAARADGAHLGDDDLPLAEARRLAGPGLLLGRSVDNPGQAAAAARAGADYVGVGPVLGTPSKPDAGVPIGMEGVAAVRGQVEVPVVAIGGIDADTAAAVARAGADGVAVIRAVMGAADPAAAARALLRAVEAGRRDAS